MKIKISYNIFSWIEIVEALNCKIDDIKKGFNFNIYANMYNVIINKN